MWSHRFRNRVCLPLIAAGLISGCQTSGRPSAGEQDYFTWVDAQGRVQQSPIIRKPAEATPPVANEENPETGVEETERDPEFNLENYPDGNQLERDGYVRPGEPQPYFSWRDAEGNIRVSYYQPDTRSAVEKGRIKPPVELTPASVHRKSDMPATVTPRDGGDPDAFAMLGIDQPEDSYLDRWGGRCCTDLDTANVEEWQRGREFGLEIDQNSESHTFLSGDSPYLMVRLPAGEERNGFVMRLRSFARDGLFVPSVAFLDADRAPLRIVTDIVADFVPESWHRRGYLEAFIPVMPEHGERWLVIYTREDDLRGQTVVDEERGPLRIPHVREGELSLTELSDR